VFDGGFGAVVIIGLPLNQQPKVLLHSTFMLFEMHHEVLQPIS